MTSTLLHLDTSARGNSFSRRLTARFAETWRATHPDGRYRYRDLAADPVPFITEAWTSLWLDQVTFPRMSLRGKRFVVAGAEDVVFVHVELTNALVDPRLATSRDAHETSLTNALWEIEELADPN